MRNASSSKIGHNFRDQSGSKIESKKKCIHQKMVSQIDFFKWFFLKKFGWSKIDFECTILANMALFDKP